MEYSLCGFRLGRTTYAIPLDKVRECLQSCNVTPIPRSPKHIGGLVCYEGKILVAINVRELLGAKSVFSGNFMSIIVHSEDTLCCLEVDEVVDVIDIQGRVLNEVPGNIDDSVKKFVRGIYKLDNDLAVLLDLEKVLNTNKYKGS